MPIKSLSGNWAFPQTFYIRKVKISVFCAVVYNYCGTKLVLVIDYFICFFRMVCNVIRIKFVEVIFPESYLAWKNKRRREIYCYAKGKRRRRARCFYASFLNFLEHIFHRANPGDCISKDIYSLFGRAPEKNTAGSLWSGHYWCRKSIRFIGMSVL